MLSGHLETPVEQQCSMPSQVLNSRAFVSGLGKRELNDRLAIVLLLVICLGAAILRFIFDDWMSGYDGFDDFLPDWGYLGDRLRQFEVPGWNPYYSSGTPFAGDPGTGWMYLPIMFTFTVLPPLLAWKTLILILELICGGALYAFARMIGLRPGPALFAGVGFAIGPVAYGLATDRIAFSTQYPSICVGLAATEMAMRTRRLPALLGWSSLIGIALAHNIASWPAQGLPYTMMYLGGWLGYRCFLAPLPWAGSRLSHIRQALGITTLAGLFTVGFAGATLWPMLELLEQSTIAGGDYTNAVGGVNLPRAPMLDLLAQLIQDIPGYRMTTMSGMVLVLAVLAVLLGRRCVGIPVFAITAWVFTDIAANESLTLPLFNLIPKFELYHAHRPTVAAVYAYPALLLLAAAGLQALQEERRHMTIVRAAGVAGSLYAGLILVLSWRGTPTGAWPSIGAGIALGSILILRSPWLRLRRLGPASASGLLTTTLIALLVIYPTGVDYGRVIFNDRQIPGLVDVDQVEDNVDWAAETTVKSTDPGTAAGFLQQQQSMKQPFRYATYYAADTRSGQHLPFLWRRLDPEIVVGLAGSRAGFLRLQQVSGVNPIHLRLYSEYFAVMQGKEQNYHFTDVFYQALDMSQLFAMLNIQYVIVTKNIGFTPPIAKYGREVYRDDLVIIYENPYAFPRAWIAHDLRPATDDSYLRSMNSYLIDGRHVAYVDGPVPAASFPTPGSPPDSAVVSDYQPERITIQTSSTSDGLLVLSEIYTSGWRASVDGQPAKILRTDYALRGVPLAAGEHEVVITYAPQSLTVGLWSTGGTTVLMVTIWCWAAADRRRQHPSQDNRPDSVP